MVWRLFATKLETAETMEGVALNMHALYFSDLDSKRRCTTNKARFYLFSKAREFSPFGFSHRLG